MTTNETREVEVTTKYVTTATDLTDAWAFVMERVDLVGPDPHIEIRPVWGAPFDSEISLAEDAAWTRHFEVVVDGMVKEGKPNE